MLTQSIAMYDAGSLEGFFMFADDLIPGMNVSFWDTWALPEMLNELTQPWLGTGQVTVVDATGSPLANASVKVFYNSTTPVTSRTTPANGTIAFSGWCGKAKRVSAAQCQPQQHYVCNGAPEMHALMTLGFYNV
eukprot:m.220235 g.220235  ORF g.220235 m.220235 type:complete len:134 (-) comp19157_c0_seq84:2605-3006(-)